MKSSLSLPVLQACPFSEEAANEDELSDQLFGRETRHDDRIGRYLECFGGHVAEGEYRDRGSSGGMGTWLVSELLRLNKVDAVVHVRPMSPTTDDPRLVQYAISRSDEEILDGAKSRYHPIEMSEVIRVIQETPGRYAFVAIPCFIKALRLLQRHDQVLAERVVFTVGLFCGHLKSLAFAQSLAWQLGVHPDSLRSFDFRHKLLDRPANRYGVVAKGAAQDEEIETPVAELYGSDWGLGFFKYKACDYCDDVVAELADVSIGDAWIPRYIEDARGANVVIVRTPELLDLIETARGEGRLELETLPASEVAKSQDAGFRHRRAGLAYRLHLTDRSGQWRPPKRVPPSRAAVPLLRRPIHAMRPVLSEASHEAFAKARAADQLDVFKREMAPLVEEYRRRYRRSSFRRWPGKVKKMARRLIRPSSRRGSP